MFIKRNGPIIHYPTVQYLHSDISNAVSSITVLQQFVHKLVWTCIKMQNVSCKNFLSVSQKSATVAEFGDCPHCLAVFCDSRTFLWQSLFSTTVALFCNGVDRALGSAEPQLKSTEVGTGCIAFNSCVKESCLWNNVCIESRKADNAIVCFEMGCR